MQLEEPEMFEFVELEGSQMVLLGSEMPLSQPLASFFALRSGSMLCKI